MLVPWSSGMIPPLQGGDHEFESRRNHSLIFKILLLKDNIFAYSKVKFNMKHV